MKKIGLVTYRDAPDLTADDALALRHLNQCGFEGVPVIWDASHVSWNYFDAIIIRSCWDYHYKVGAFNDWINLIERLEVPLWNPAEIIRWNMNKEYLKDLAAKGIKIPQTIWLDPGSSVNLCLLLQENGLDQAVVKPTISLSAAQTWRTSPDIAPAQQARLDTILKTSGVLVQRFVDQVLTAGEWSLLFFGGRYSHAVLKHPKPGDFRVQSEFGGTTSLQLPAQELVEQAEAITRIVDKPLLYARVDGVEIDGEFTLLELELIEPELFLGSQQQAPQRFAEAINHFVNVN